MQLEHISVVLKVHSDLQQTTEGKKPKGLLGTERRDYFPGLKYERKMNMRK